MYRIIHTYISKIERHISIAKMNLVNSFKDVLAKYKLTYALISSLVNDLVCIYPNIPAEEIPMPKYMINKKTCVKLVDIAILNNDDLTPFANTEGIYAALHEDAKITPLGVDGTPICMYRMRNTYIPYFFDDNIIWANAKYLAKLSGMSYNAFIDKLDDNITTCVKYINIQGIRQAICDDELYEEIHAKHVSLGDTCEEEEVGVDEGDEDEGVGEEDEVGGVDEISDTCEGEVGEVGEVDKHITYRGIIKFNNMNLPYIIAYSDVWVVGNILMKALGYKSAIKTLQGIDPKYKCFLHYLNKQGEYMQCNEKSMRNLTSSYTEICPAYNPSENIRFSKTERAVYVNKEGTLHIINNSRTDVAKRLRENMIKVYAKLDNDPGADVSEDLCRTELTIPLPKELRASTSGGGEPTTKVDPPSDYSEAYARRHLPKKYYTTCIYIFYTYHLDMHGKKIYKTGKTDSILQRLKDHVKKYGCIDEIYVFPCINVNMTENNCLYALRVLKALKDKPQCINGDNTKELITIPEHMTHGDILSTIESGVKAADDEIVSSEVRIEEEKTKQEEAKANTII